VAVKVASIVVKDLKRKTTKNRRRDFKTTSWAARGPRRLPPWRKSSAAGLEDFRFEGIMGGNSEWGGSEAVTVVSRKRGVEKRANFEYKLMATSETSTMQKEMQQAADQGFGYRGQNVFDTAFGGNEVVVIMERDRDAKPERHEYKLLATSKTSTLQKD
jgi:hypothetical protein